MNLDTYIKKILMIFTTDIYPPIYIYYLNLLSLELQYKIN